MPFIGKSPTAGFASIVKDDLTPNGSTTAFTLSKQVANANDIAVFLGNVRQEPTDAYTVSGTTLTMSEAPASGLNFYVLHIAGTHESSVVPADGTITNAKIVGMASSKLTGALPALDGSALTGIAGTFIAAEEGEYTGSDNSISTTGTSSYAQFSGLGNSTPLSYTTTQNSTTVTLILTLHNGGSSLSDVTEIEVRRSDGTVVGRHRDNSSDNAYFSSFTIVDQQNVTTSGTTVSYTIWGRTIGGGNPQSVRYNRKVPKWIWLEAAQ
jgi:hypothetical protein